MRVPMPLPWKRPQKGLAIAEAGVTFRVERGEEGWECSLTQGRKKQVLATGLQRQRDGLCRAEAHAATMPEVRAALARAEEGEAEAAPARERNDKRKKPRKAATKKKGRRRTEPKPAPAKAPAAPATKPAITFAPVEDGCICGQVGDVTWVADPQGRVEFTGEVAADDKQKVQRAARQHFQASGKADAGEKKSNKPDGEVAAKKSTRSRTKEKSGKTKGTPAAKGKTPKEPKGARPSVPDKVHRLHWTSVADGERASTPAGAFAIVAEGDRRSLYFYDLNGQSRFLTDRGDLKQAAEELAARGELGPSTRRPSAELHARMQEEFLRQASEEVTP